MCNQAAADSKITSSAMEELKKKQVEELNDDEQYEAKWQQALREMRASSERIARLCQNKVCEFLLWHIFGFV
jgi:hypothetical protein